MATADISRLILAELARNGGDIPAAIDTILGTGTYAALVIDLYSALRGDA